MEHNIFAYIQPKIVILTTPNADFNVLFENFNRMRDADHKFEWTREEYKDWQANFLLLSHLFCLHLKVTVIVFQGFKYYKTVSKLRRNV